MSALKLFGLLGKSLEHSFSERYFKAKFQNENLTNCDYRNFELSTLDELPELLDFFPELLGFNVTIPYKEQILKYIDILDEKAQKVGAVNVVLVKRFDKKVILKGYNTDVYGFEVTLMNTIKDKNLNALILGAGGAAKSVAFVLDELKIQNDFVSRNKYKNTKYLYQDLSERVICEHKLIINTTPLGMYPKVNYCPDIPYEHISEEHILIDLIYNPSETEFLKKGKLKGATIVNGQEMLVSQAEKSWEIFTNG